MRVDNLPRCVDCKEAMGHEIDRCPCCKGNPRRSGSWGCRFCERAGCVPDYACNRTVNDRARDLRRAAGFYGLEPGTESQIAHAEASAALADIRLNLLGEDEDESDVAIAQPEPAIEHKRSRGDHGIALVLLIALLCGLLYWGLGWLYAMIVLARSL